MSKKILLSLSVIGTLFAYAFALKHHNSEDGARTVTANPTPTTDTATTATQTSVPSTTTTTPITTAAKYKDGTYTGDSVNAYYGNVQVQVTISDGKITDVTFLDYPQDRDTSRMINQQAMPILKQEVIQAQSANVGGVSGASATSPAFIESLTTALNQAAA